MLHIRPLNLIFLTLNFSSHPSQVWHVRDAEQPDARRHGAARQHAEPGVWFGSGHSGGHHSRVPHGDIKGQSRWTLSKLL